MTNAGSAVAGEKPGKFRKLLSQWRIRQIQAIAPSEPEVVVAGNRILGISAVEFAYLGKYRILLDINSKSIVTRTLRDGSYQLSLMEKVASLVDAKSLLFVNVGANVGTTMLNAHHVGFRDFVAFEPVGRNFQLLQNNTASLRQDSAISLFNAAAASRSGRATINLNLHSTGRHSLVRAFGGDAEDVELKRLDDCLPLRRGIIWIDAEGFELEVVKGGMNYIKTWAELLCIEVTPALAGQANVNELSDLLGSHFTRYTTLKGETAESIKALESIQKGKGADVICLK